MIKRILLVGLILLCSSLAFSAEDAIEVVNAQRARRGLRPFIRLECLTKGAVKCADYRAKRLIEGHSRNDFAFLPEGCSASVGGCCAWPAEMREFGACDLYANWKYAGCAWTKGRDGRMYCQAFYSNRKN